ncbi:MAG: DUF4240 domain-containing protein [Flavobacteriaceae bacterium]|jgi:hypothetical protein|nr:DUF4240 domain-containing protein [Flavobacteriaceae bacterium]
MSIINQVQTEQEVFFWKVIEESNQQEGEGWEDYDQEEHIDEIIDKLSQTDKNHLIVFEKVMQQKLHELYTAEIAELYMILLCDFSVDEDKIEFEDYISEDEFIYFRCWLLLKGKAFFDDIQKDIENFVNGEYSFDISECWGEELLYVADAANEVMNGVEQSEEIRDTVFELYPDLVHYDNVEETMNREIHNGLKLQQVYPELVAEICDVRMEAEENDDDDDEI